MPRRIQPSSSFWFAATAYAVCGVSLFFVTSFGSRVFTNLDGSFPVPIRIVIYLGPIGWMGLAVLGCLATLCMRSTFCRPISSTIFSLVTVGVLCTVLFTSVERPSFISSSNQTASVHGETMVDLQSLSQRPGVAELAHHAS